MTDHQTNRPHSHPQLGRSGWMLLVLLALLWGGSFAFNELALQQMGPVTIVTWRVAGGCVALWLAAGLLGVRVPLDGRIWAGFFVLGLLNNIVPFFLIVWGQARIDSGLASILNATTPMFSLVLAHLVTADERINTRRVVGLVCGLLGIVVLVGPGVLSEVGVSWLGQAAVLGAGLSYAAAGVFGRRFRGIEPMVLALGMLTASSVIALPIAFVLEEPWTLPSQAIVWLALLGLAVPGAAIAYVLYYRILASAGATNLMLVTLLIPFAAIFLGVTFLGEAVSGAMVVGGALVLAGLAVIDGKLIGAR